MAHTFTNNATATLASGISDTDTTINLTSGQGALFPTLSSGDDFFATLVDSSNNLEIIKVTARSTDSLTVVRAQESTTARAYLASDKLELRPTAQILTDFTQTSAAQTLTNKTINLTANTLSGTKAQFNTALSDDDFVTLTGSETLTNKTLTSPTITGTISGGTVAGANVSGDITGNAAGLTGTLGVANGGTGATTLTSNAVILGNGTSAVGSVSPGTSGNVLTSNGSAWVSQASSSGATIVRSNASEAIDTQHSVSLSAVQNKVILIDLNLHNANEANNVSILVRFRGGFDGSYTGGFDQTTTTAPVNNVIVDRSSFSFALSVGSNGTFYYICEITNLGEGTSAPPFINTRIIGI